MMHSTNLANSTRNPEICFEDVSGKSCTWFSAPRLWHKTLSESPELNWHEDISGNWQPHEDVFFARDNLRLITELAIEGYKQNYVLNCFEPELRYSERIIDRWTSLLKTICADDQCFVMVERPFLLDSEELSLERSFAAASNRISGLCLKESNLEYPPNETARRLALDALELLRQHDILPSLINATNDQSIVFEFFVNENKYSLDFCNSGEIVFLEKRIDSRTLLVELNEKELGEAISEITHAYGEQELQFTENTKASLD